MALVEDAGFPHVGNCSLDVRSKGRSCVRGESFGCLPGDRPGVWVRGGCRGQFAVGGLRVACGHPELGEQEQSCHAARFRNAGADTTDVWAAGSVRALDDSKAILDRAPWQALVQALRSSATGIGTTILIGVINGHAERRAPFRCEFAQLLPSRGRLRFVVGSDAPARAEETDLLIVPEVPEFIHYHNHNGGGGSEGSARRWEGTGSMSSLLKLFFFLEWAAHQPEQVIARLDDDVFVSLLALEVHAAALAPFGDYFYAGVFEWYSYIPAIFKSTGHSFGVGGARALGERLHNCTPSAVKGSSAGSGCVGPFAFVCHTGLEPSTSRPHALLLPTRASLALDRQRVPCCSSRARSRAMRRAPPPPTLRAPGPSARRRASTTTCSWARWWPRCRASRTCGCGASTPG